MAQIPKYSEWRSPFAICLAFMMTWMGCSANPLGGGDTGVGSGYGDFNGDGDGMSADDCYSSNFPPVIEFMHMDGRYYPLSHGDGLPLNFLTDGGTVSYVHVGVAGIALSQITDLEIQILLGSELLASSTVSDEKVPVCTGEFLVWSDLLLEYPPIYGPEDLLEQVVTLRVTGMGTSSSYTDEVEVVLIW
jgi:hypothetical protein